VRLTKKNIMIAVVVVLFSGSILMGVADILFREPEVIEIVVLETSLGVIEVQLDRAKAPKTVENFVAYVEQGFYDGLVFHRVMAGFVVQGGGFQPDGTWKTPTRDPVETEARNGLKNLGGTIAMARSSNPDSATSQFFISTVDNPSLDYPNPDGYGYTVFGKIVKGMDVVDEIEASRTGSKGTPYGAMEDWPIENVVIVRAYMKES